MALTINIIGAGNLAYHLTKALYTTPNVHLQQLYNRSGFTAEFEVFKTEKTTNLSSLRPANLTILAVKDEAIAPLSAALPYQGQLVVHTSGNTPMGVIAPAHRAGVFYPLQSFSKTAKVHFSSVPICIEAQDPADIDKLLHPLAKRLSSKVYILNSEQRSSLHVAAVFLNNFTNHLIGISQQICEQHQVPFNILQPLLSETFAKLQKMPALEAQTGPARRNDTQTIENHLAILPEHYQRIYKVITESIIHTYYGK